MNIITPSPYRSDFRSVSVVDLILILLFVSSQPENEDVLFFHAVSNYLSSCTS